MKRVEVMFHDGVSETIAFQGEGLIISTDIEAFRVIKKTNDSAEVVFFGSLKHCSVMLEYMKGEELVLQSEVGVCP